MIEKTSPEKTLALLRKIYFGSICSGVLQKIDDQELTFIQRNILHYLRRNPNKTPSDVAENFCIKKSSITRIIDLLEKNGYVVSINDKVDKRRTFLNLTKKAQDKVKNIDNVPLQKLGKMFSVLSSKEQKVLLKGCATLVKGFNLITEKSRTGN
ncbi:MAG: hypothetical protein A2252_11185 [Elusimicrobia bacterium RIFOXYA2_FULL_39_19]|nr:MAG: hypothetical protein A2252_11185 [Elusimicrobia bacterium RIFOXYA2_FULL_39_19]